MGENVEEKPRAWWKRKKVWAAILSVAIPILNRVLGLGLEDAVDWQTPLAGAAYMFGQGAADWGKEKS